MNDTIQLSEGICCITPVPSGVPSLVPSSSYMPSMAPIPYTRSPRIDVRYLSWDDLTDDQKTAAILLSYNRSSWDNPGTNPIELLQYDSLSAEESSAAFTLGYPTPLTWDCWQNHYTSYNWTYLGATYIQVVQWYEILGWNAIKWMELTTKQQSDAILIGFYQRTWDCYQNHYRAYFWDDFDTHQDIKDALKTLGWLRDTWTGVGGVEPMSYNMPWLGLNATEQSAATTLCFFENTWNEQTLQSVEVGVASSADLLDPRNSVWISIGVLVLSCISGSFVQY